VKNLIKTIGISLLLVSCNNLAVQDQSAGSLIDLQNNPDPTALATAAQGLMFGTRLDMPFQVILVGSQGREGWSLDPSDPGWRNVLVLFDNTTFYAGSFFNWRDIYRNIKLENVVLKATDAIATLTDAQKDGIRGFTKTFQALDLLNIIETRDVNGAVIDPNDDPAGSVGAVVDRATTYARINQLLDDAYTRLGNAGATFAMKLSPGFSGFDTPPTFKLFNRALRARSAVYTQDYNGALTALNLSFVDPTKAMTLGAYHTYTTNSGDQLPNPLLFDPTGRVLVAHPSFFTDAQKQADGVTLDKRFTSKTIKLPAAKTLAGSNPAVTSQYAFNVYPANVSPITIIRNEDLILLRAEAEWFTGAKASAITDINAVRTVSGGLQACGVLGSPCTLTAASTDDQFIDALLYERRYSLVWEGGHRWIDSRRLGRLATLPIDRPQTDHVFSAWPVPSDECANRTPQPVGCAQPLAASQVVK
jgi:hypothetical protein